jgi:hypothetical protein
MKKEEKNLYFFRKKWYNVDRLGGHVMAVEIYEGTHVKAEPATNYMDVNTIYHACKLIKDASARLERTSKKIINAKDYCTKEALFMLGESFEEPIEFCGKDFYDISDYIHDFADTVLEATSKALDKKQLLLNEEAMEKEKLEILKEETTVE